MDGNISVGQGVLRVPRYPSPTGMSRVSRANRDEKTGHSSAKALRSASNDFGDRAFHDCKDYF
jgi:hypothetical protein